MRKLVAITAAALLLGGFATVAPASAATPKAGTKCTTLLNRATVGSSTLVCAHNTNNKTRKKMPKIWKKASVDCLDDLKSMTDLMVGYNAAKEQVDAMQAAAKAGTLTPEEMKAYEAKIAGWLSALADVKKQLDGAVPMYRDMAIMSCSGIMG